MVLPLFDFIVQTFAPGRPVWQAGQGVDQGFLALLFKVLAIVLGLQTFLVLGGVTKLIPHTGLTTPFMSQGGSSLIANWIIIAILMVISHRSRMPQAATAAPRDMSLLDDATAVISR